MSPMGLYMSAFWLCLFVLAPIIAFFARRRARTAIIFRHLGTIVQQNLPLTPALLAAAHSERGLTRHVLIRVARRTAMGMPLSRALAMSYRALPALALSVVESAERSGTLPSALREFNEHYSLEPEPATRDMASRWLLYSGMLFGFVAVYIVGSFLVFPKLLRLFGEGEFPASALLQDVLYAHRPWDLPAQTTLGHVFRLLLAGLAVLTPLVIAYGIALLRPGHANHRSLISMARDFVQWFAWPWRKLAWADYCSRALPTLRLTLAAGWPLPDAVESASEIDANYYARRCFQSWAERLRKGEEVIAAGRAAGLPEMLLAQVAVGVRDGDLNGPLYFAEGYYRGLKRRWTLFLIQLAWPLITMYIGAIMGILTAAIVLSLRDVIDHACAMFG